MPSALHVNDCAFTAQRLLIVAHERGYPWSFMPLASPPRTWSGPVRRAQRAALGILWLAKLQTAALHHDLLHLHSGSILQHTRFVHRRFVLHLHGTDIRTLQYQPRMGPIIRDGLHRAEAVFYSTPDLREHVLPLRPDAELMPVPLLVDQLPRWSPSVPRPVIFFASRWEAVKGGPVQLEAARQLHRALADRSELVGLNWGPQAPAAAAAGVRLLPRMAHEDYLTALSRATVVVGQSGGILAASELEALGIGTPVVIPVELPLYADAPPPLLASGSVEVAVDGIRALLDGDVEPDPQLSRDWVQANHDAGHAVDTLVRTYCRIMG